MNFKISKSHLTIASFICLYAAAVLLLQNTVKVHPPYSSESPGSLGTKAFFLLTDELGYDSQRLESGLRPGSSTDKKLLVVIDQSSSTKTTGAGTELTKWVKSGGNLLLFTQRNSSLTDSFGITVDNREFRGLAKLRTSAFTRNVHKLNFQTGRYLSVKNSESEVIAEGDEGPVSIAFPFGRGRIVAVSDPSIITNSQVQKFDNIVLLLNVMRIVQPQTIWFDESGGTIAGKGKNEFSFKSTYILAAIELAAAVILLFIYWGKRFGRPLPLPDGSKGASAQYINTMANIFRQAKARDIALDNIYEAFWHNLCKSLGVPDSITPADVISLCRQGANLDCDRLQEIINSVKKIRQQGNSTEAEVFALVHDMEIWRRENLKNARH